MTIMGDFVADFSSSFSAIVRCIGVVSSMQDLGCYCYKAQDIWSRV